MCNLQAGPEPERLFSSGVASYTELQLLLCSQQSPDRRPSTRHPGHTALMVNSFLSPMKSPTREVGAGCVGQDVPTERGRYGCLERAKNNNQHTPRAENFGRSWNRWLACLGSRRMGVLLSLVTSRNAFFETINHMCSRGRLRTFDDGPLSVQRSLGLLRHEPQSMIKYI